LVPFFKTNERTNGWNTVLARLGGLRKNDIIPIRSKAVLLCLWPYSGETTMSRTRNVQVATSASRTSHLAVTRRNAEGRHTGASRQTILPGTMHGLSHPALHQSLRAVHLDAIRVHGYMLGCMHDCSL